MKFTKHIKGKFSVHMILVIVIVIIVSTICVRLHTGKIEKNEVRTSSFVPSPEVYNQSFFDFYCFEDLGQTISGIESKDFNNDKKMDFAASYSSSPFNHSYISIFYNIGNLEFVRTDIFSFEKHINDINAGDYDNDGDIDFLFTYSESVNITINNTIFSVRTNGTIIFLENIGNNIFIQSRVVAKHYSKILDHYGRQNPRLASADLDNDGDLDFLVGDNSGMVEFYKNTGDGTFFSAGIIHDFGCLSWGITSSDYDNDGDIDVVVSAEVEQKSSVLIGRLYLIKNPGSFDYVNSSGIKVIENISKYSGVASIVIFDYDKDEQLELFVGIRDKIYLIKIVNNSYDKVSICTLNKSSEGYIDDLKNAGISVADFNNDGYMDVVIGGLQGKIRILLNSYNRVQNNYI